MRRGFVLLALLGLGIAARASAGDQPAPVQGVILQFNGNKVRGVAANTKEQKFKPVFEKELAKLAAQLPGKPDLKLSHWYTVINGCAIRWTKGPADTGQKLMKELQKLPYVKTVEPDAKVKANSVMRADDPPKATRVTVCNLGVLAPLGKVLFLPGPSGVEAIAVFNGKPLWQAKGTGVPLLATADYVVSQIQVKGKKNQVKLVVLDAATGERRRVSDALAFPEWVSVPLDFGHRFRSAARLDKESVLFVWEASTFSDGGEPPPDPDPNAKQAGGAFRLDVKSGRVSAVKAVQPKEGELPDWTPGQTKRDGWVFRVEEKSPEPAYPHVLTARMLIAEREDKKGSWKRPLVGQPHLPPRP